MFKPKYSYFQLVYMKPFKVCIQVKQVYTQPYYVPFPKNFVSCIVAPCCYNLNFAIMNAFCVCNVSGFLRVKAKTKYNNVALRAIKYRNIHITL